MRSYNLAPRKGAGSSTSWWVQGLQGRGDISIGRKERGVDTVGKRKEA